MWTNKEEYPSMLNREALRKPWRFIYQFWYWYSFISYQYAMECPADCRPAAQSAEDPGELPRHHRTGRALHCTGWVTVGRRTCMLQCRDSLTSITYIYGGKED